jgi:phospholipase C
VKRLAFAVLLGLLLSGANAEAGRSRDCPYAAGALPAETLRDGLPHGDQIPIDHIVVLMQENRSFDHMLGQLHNEGQPNAVGLKGLNANPTPKTGVMIRSFHQTRLCEVADLAHSWNATHREYNNGWMSGFAEQNATGVDPTGRRAMGYLTSDDIPFYYALYATFAMGDHYFSSVLGPTYPNRFFLVAGTSFGRISNEFPSTPDEYGPSIFDLLEDAGVTWKVYYNDIPFAGFFKGARTHAENFVRIDQFYVDAENGELPQVAYVDPAFFGDEQSDEHPPSNVQFGQAFTAGVIDALMHSPNWPRSAMFLMYDEHGGYYDHVVPPAACVPDATPPRLTPTSVPGAFDRYGIRVPMVAISPFSRAHFVSHRTHDHTSILRFIEARFDLPALTARDANTEPPFELFDFESPPFLTPPVLPDAEIDPVRAAECQAP